MKPEDYDRMKWVKLFNKFDLYTKVSRTGIQHASLHCIDRFFSIPLTPLLMHLDHNFARTLTFLTCPHPTAFNVYFDEGRGK